jgi:hypothetical protein
VRNLVFGIRRGLFIGLLLGAVLRVSRQCLRRASGSGSRLSRVICCLLVATAAASASWVAAWTCGSAKTRCRTFAARRCVGDGISIPKSAPLSTVTTSHSCVGTDFPTATITPAPTIASTSPPPSP